MKVLQPIMECPAEDWAVIRGVFMDIDCRPCYGLQKHVS